MAKVELEGEFCEVELPLYGVLRSSPNTISLKFAFTILHSPGPMWQVYVAGSYVMCRGIEAPRT
jgi:hypothetical protein